MTGRGSTLDPIKDEAARSVLQAFQAARNSGRPSVDCYRAGVEAWRRIHPDHSAEYAAKQAVAIILSVHVELRVDKP